MSLSEGWCLKRLSAIVSEQSFWLNKQAGWIYIISWHIKTVRIRHYNVKRNNIGTLIKYISTAGEVLRYIADNIHWGCKAVPDSLLLLADPWYSKVYMSINGVYRRMIITLNFQKYISCQKMCINVWFRNYLIWFEFRSLYYAINCTWYNLTERCRGYNKSSRTMYVTNVTMDDYQVTMDYNDTFLYNSWLTNITDSTSQYNTTIYGHLESTVSPELLNSKCSMTSTLNNWSMIA